MSPVVFLALLLSVAPPASAWRLGADSAVLENDGQPADRVLVDGRPLPLEAKILVVGAGPSGLHMAYMLRKKGYQDIHILEKTDRVGGKSFTFYFNQENKECKQNLDEPDWKCAQMEMGTCFLHNGYDRVRNLNHELGLHPELAPVKGEKTLDEHGGAGTRAIQAQAIMSKEHFDGEARPFQEYMSKLLEKIFGGHLEMQREVEFLRGVEKYIQRHRELMHYSNPAYTFPERPNETARMELSKTFQQFLTDNGLNSLESVLRVAQAAQGYGYLTRVPAYFGLLWITPELLCGSAMYLLLAKFRVNEGVARRFKTWVGSDAYYYVTRRFAPSCASWQLPGRVVTEMTTMLPQGYQALWDRIYESHFDDNVEFLVSGLEITRNHMGGTSERPVEVKYTVPGSDGRVNKSGTYDFLVYSAPQRVAHKYIKDLTDLERRLFSEHWAGATLRTQVWSSPPIPTYSDERTNVGLLYVADNVVDGRQGTWMGDNSINVFRQPPDFSEHPLKRAIQYWDEDLGDLDRQPPATSELHSRVKGHEDEKRALREHFQTLGVENLGRDLETDLKESLREWAPSLGDAIESGPKWEYGFPWPYFSRFDAKGVELGEPWELFAAQGTDGGMPYTWHVGGSVVFESVNDIISYNLQLLHKNGQWTEGFESNPMTRDWATWAELEACKHMNQHENCPQATL